MAALFILSISVAVQILAAILALRLIRVSGGRIAWIALASAILLMALRRMMTLGRALLSYPDAQPVFQTELVALVISGLVLTAVVLIRPLFETVRRSEQDLFAEKEKAQVTLEAIGDGVVSLDLEGRVQYMNPVAETLCGRKLSEALGRRYDRSVLLLDERSREPLPDLVALCVDAGSNTTLGEKILLAHKTGAYEHAIEAMVSPIKDRAGETIGVVLVLHDVTQLRGLAEELSYQATHDSLTGLVNRSEFERLLEALIDRAELHEDAHTMCYLDMDDFKVVNDTCGHIAGDEMLKSIGNLLRDSLRETDVLARLGGDEFGILFTAQTAEDALVVIERIRDTIGAFSFEWDGNVFRAGMSIGVVPIDHRSGTITDVLSAADSACYVAKERGRNRIHVFSEDDAAVSKRFGQMQWVQRIQRALDEDRFELFHQPIRPVKPNAGRPLTEILLRLNGEDGALIQPGVFLPAAERYHLMRTIDRWVIDHVFERIASGQAEIEENALVTINLSGQSLGDEGLLDFALRAFARHSVPYDRICFEITETAVIRNIVFARYFIEVLRTRGCHFALDDFGSGLSSFSYLKTLPVDFLKIDGSFIRGLLRDPKDRNLVVSINQIGHVMGIHTIAEFVEDDETASTLREIGVDYLQGFGIASPCWLTTPASKTGTAAAG